MSGRPGWTVGTVRRISPTGYVRDDRWAGDGVMHPAAAALCAVHVTGHDDVSAPHSIHDGYDSRCSWCWHGFPHSSDAHAVGVSTS